MKKVENKTALRNSATNNKRLRAVERKGNVAPVKIRKVGNSKGILLSNNMLHHLGVKEGEEVTITTEPGQLTIKPATKPTINTDLSTWEAQFKEAIQNGDTPEKDLFEGMNNEFDTTAW